MQDHTIHPRGYFEPRCARCCADKGVAGPVPITCPDLPPATDLHSHRAELARREYNSYDSENFPGSKGWLMRLRERPETTIWLTGQRHIP